MEKSKSGGEEERHIHKYANYWPLFALIIVSMLVGWAASYSGISGVFGFMHYFMGFFLVSFATLKLFNPSGFADGFQMYDLLAKHLRLYALLYPFIELGLGLGYLSFYNPKTIYMATIIVFVFSAIGVVFSLRRGLKINCACMGTVLNVPLSTVTLTEDIAMSTMAIWMLYN
jgi:hypothetical protein